MVYKNIYQCALMSAFVISFRFCYEDRFHITSAVFDYSIVHYKQKQWYTLILVYNHLIVYNHHILLANILATKVY